jgi:hypothetical protein
VFAIVGVFGAWRNTGPLSLDGVEGPHNGWLVIIFGLIALAGVGALARGSWFGIVLVLGAVDAVANDGSVLGGRSGWGVWLTVAASAALAVAAVLAAIRRLRPGLDY